MSRVCVFLMRLLWGVGLLLIYSAPAQAQDHYKGKTLRFIVGQAAGGGYDTYTRTLARHISKHIPGNPTTTVENMTGAGSLIAANYIYSSTKPDGLTIGNWNSALVLNQALGDANVRFDARKFGWIGAPSKGIPVCLAMGFTGLKTFEDVLSEKKSIRMGATGAGSHSVDLPLLLNKMIGTRFHVVTGYGGTSEIRLSMQRKETDGTCTNWESVTATMRPMLDAKGDERLIPFIIHSRLKDPEVKDLPLFTEVLKEDDAAIYKAYMAQMEYQRPLTVSPGTSKEHLEILRRAFKATLEDPEFLAEAKKSRLDITYVSGEEIDKIVNEVLSISPKVKGSLQFLVPIK
jgi:tripartite-type tricarboxylate transporter receptor subunit TctC